MGRKDNQVNIRGFRIELEEIESQLIKLEDINEAVVIAKKDYDNNDILNAFVTSDKDEIDIEKIKNELSKSLPEYMIPNNIKNWKVCLLQSIKKLIENFLQK